MLPLRAISQGLAAGCTIVLKASELCPKTHHLLTRCFEEAGIPKGVINVIQAKREDAAAVTEAIISHKAIKKIDFIGSAAVGRQIGQVCAKHLKPILMELGGKGPAIVLEDADLQKAAFLCTMGGKYNVSDVSLYLLTTFSNRRPWTALFLDGAHHSAQVCSW